MDLKYVIYEKLDHIALIKLNRPAALNALCTELLQDLSAVVDEFENDNDIRVAIITGEGKAFAAGADIVAMKDMYALDGLAYCQYGEKLYRHLEQVRKPVIAAINGFALGGGCELTLACDLRIASTKAVLGLPETGLGLIPGFGGSQRLARLIGDTKAKELIYTANNIKAQEALEIGLLNKVVEPEALMDEAMAMANKIASNAPLAVAFAKEAINRGRQVDIDSAMTLESSIVSILFSSEDVHEGMTAFVEKRKPEYKGK